MRSGSGALQPATWDAILPSLAERFSAAGSANPEGVKFLLSAHASHEELFLFRGLAEQLIGAHGARAISVSWRYQRKAQPEHSTFKVPAVDAPNVNGARLLGLAPGQTGDSVGDADLLALRAAVESGRVSALYVFDPGPVGSLGDTQWILDARARGWLPLLIVQGVLLSDLARAADFVLPGASYVEKEASYTNDRGRTQGTARVIPPPGDAVEDWHILVRLAGALGVPLQFESSSDVRAAISRQLNIDLSGVAFGTRMGAHNWFQGSNPSERWKWDFMFQDLPPVKGTVDVTSLPLPPGSIELKVVK
jgi:predicted molibdopterin-dependent oxidoreductase YjgC